MLRRFTTEEYDILTICERNGWTYAQWFALPEDEQIDRLAMQHRRRVFLETILEGFDNRIKNEQGIEQTAYINTLIERYIS